MAKTVTVSGLAPASTVANAAPSASWISLTLSGTALSTLGVSVGKNDTGAERSANVTVTSTDGATVTLPITQQGYSLTVDKTTLTLTAAGGAASTNSNKLTITSAGTGWTIT